MAQVFKYYITPQQNTARNRWVLQYIIEILGLKPLQLDECNSEVQLLYGTLEKVPEEYEGLFISADPSALIDATILDNGYVGDHGKQLAFDIISAVGNFMTDTVNRERLPAHYDRHQRLNQTGSYQFQVGYHEQPIVNVYIQFLHDWIQAQYSFESVPLLPNGARSAIILSHDVDNPIKYNILQPFHVFPKHLSAKHAVLHYLEAAKKFSERSIYKDSDIYWSFKDIIDRESSHNFVSTFFFAARNKYDRHANYTYDVPYDISSKDFADVFRLLNDRNFEIGLHASYNARKGAHLLVEEKNRLQEMAGREIVGNRHHFWQIGEPAERTLENHCEAGLLYDSSLAFNDAPGYRRNIALPYFPFDEAKELRIDNMQIPTFLMDSNVLKGVVGSSQEPVARAKQWIDGLLDVGGVGALDWHVRTSFPSSKRFKIWGETYLAILDYLATKKGLWVTNFETFYQWMIERQSRVLHGSA